MVGPPSPGSGATRELMLKDRKGKFPSPNPLPEEEQGESNPDDPPSLGSRLRLTSARQVGATRELMV